jgi:hypothetical protein
MATQTSTKKRESQQERRGGRKFPGEKAALFF